MTWLLGFAFLCMLVGFSTTMMAITDGVDAVEKWWTRCQNRTKR